MNQKLKVIKRAREIILKEENWTKGSFGTLDRRPTSIPSATSFCSIGSIMRARFELGEADYLDMSEAELELQSRVNNNSLAQFNDTHTHAEVLALFDRTIAELESINDSQH